jgi:hypothetical protein
MDSREYEYGEERACEHDDEVMCHHVFFDDTTRAHLARHRLKAILEARTHWVIGVTPDCVSYSLRLEMLHRQRCGERMLTLHINDLHIQPLMCLLPRDRFSLDDIMSVLGGINTSREVIESKQWLLLTSDDIEASQEAITRWVSIDAVLN